MYRKYTNTACSALSCTSKILLVMKLTAILMTFAVIQVSARGFAQSITLTQKNITIAQVFNEIKKQTGYRVLYSDKLIDDQQTVDVDFKSISLKEVLETVLPTHSVGYVMTPDKSIVLQAETPSFTASISAFFAATSIHGRVLDNNGSPMADVTIKVKGAPTFAITDAEGKFTINIPKEGATLLFSHVGYTPQEVRATENMVVNMQPSINKLDDMVVVGYGSTRRKDLTGSVASVNVGEIKDVPFATIDQALAGKAAGVQVVQSDGAPGGVAKIRIRGGTSLLGGNDPLYIIDGVQLQVQDRYQTAAADIVSPTERFGNDDPNNTISGSFARDLNSLGGLNINDIETIDILKDASATAIYGSKAANGVIIITTKKGKYNQKPSLDAHYYAGLTKATPEKVLNRDQYISLFKEAATNLNTARAAVSQAPDPTATQILTNPSYLGTANTDWMKLVLRNAVTQNADISVRGGGAGSRYYTSLTYNKNNGSVKGTDYRRIAGKISLDNDINTRLRFNTNLDYGFTTSDITNGMYTQALFAPPTFPAYNADGSVAILSPSQVGAYAYQGYQNPLALLKGINRSNAIFLIGSLAGEYDILKSLKFRSSVSVNYNSYRQTNYVPSTVSIATSSGTGPSNNGMATQAQSQDANLFYENTLTWNKEFDANNRLTLLAGTSWQSTKSSSFSASAQGFPDDTYLNNLSSAAVTLPATGLSDQSSLLSFYMRANYALYDKYLFTFTGRSDASSKFPKDNRVGYFPSGGVAWRISQENFLKKAHWIDELKLRASAGYTGTQNIGSNLFYTLYSPVSYAGTNGLTPTQLGNNGLKWESTLQKDAGIDFELFKARLHGTAGFYEKTTTGVLFPATTASSSGFTSVTANIAKIRNRGIELEIGGDFVRGKHFQWSGDLNISGNRSRVLALSNDFANPANPTVYNYGNTILEVGKPIGLLYGNVFQGILKTQKEVDDYKAKYLFAAFGLAPYLGIGDAKYELDTPIYAGLSVYKTDIIGHAEPKFYGGLTNTFTYDNFTLSTLITFSYGGDILYLADIQNHDASVRTNKGISALKRWTPDNPNAPFPRMVLGQSPYAYTSSMSVYKASYARLKSVTFSYQLPKKLMSSAKISGASLYIAATNLITVTHYPGADPEVSNDPYSLIGGYSDSGGYPGVKQFSAGLRCSF